MARSQERLPQPMSGSCEGAGIESRQFLPVERTEGNQRGFQNGWLEAMKSVVRPNVSTIC